MVVDCIRQQPDKVRRAKICGPDETEVRVLRRLISHHARHPLPLLRLRPHVHLGQLLPDGAG